MNIQKYSISHGAYPDDNLGDWVKLSDYNQVVAQLDMVRRQLEVFELERNELRETIHKIQYGIE